MKPIVAVLALLAVASCESRPNPDSAVADTAVTRSPAPDTASPVLADSIMVRDTAAVP